MKSTYTSSDLRLEILALEAQCLQREENLKKTVHAAMDSLKPANLIRSTFNSTVRAPGFSRNMLKGAVGLAAGFFSKKLFVMGSSNIVKKALGTVVELGVAKAIAGNASKIGQTGKKLLGKALR